MNHSFFLPDGLTLCHGKYTIVRAIAAGGFGCTYEARDNLSGLRVAIKEFFVKDFCNRNHATHTLSVASESKIDTVGDLLFKFLEEARALSEMNHPGIVHVTEVFEENSTAYFVMNYIDGPTLSSLCKNGNYLDQDTALRYIVKVAKALEYVHSCGRLHLDIKPENVMIDADGEVKIIDFGVSKMFDDHKGANTSSIAGITMGYASLEQSSGDIAMLSYASDVYSLGATLYTLLSGKVPPPATLIAAGKPLDPLPLGVSPLVQNLILESMASKVSLRPQSVSEFLAHLAPLIPPDEPQENEVFYIEDDGEDMNNDTAEAAADTPAENAQPIRDVAPSVHYQQATDSYQYYPSQQLPRRKSSVLTMVIWGVAIAIVSFVVAMWFFTHRIDASHAHSAAADTTVVTTDTVPADSIVK